MPSQHDPAAAAPLASPETDLDTAVRRLVDNDPSLDAIKLEDVVDKTNTNALADALAKTTCPLRSLAVRAPSSKKMDADAVFEAIRSNDKLRALTAMDFYGQRGYDVKSLSAVVEVSTRALVFSHAVSHTHSQPLPLVTVTHTRTVNCCPSRLFFFCPTVSDTL